MIELKNVSKTYVTKESAVVALKHIDLKLDATGFFSIVGPSGCGKTTLLNMIGGLDQPTSGEILFNHKSTSLFNEKEWATYRNQHIGFVFQNSFLIPHLNIIDNVALPLTLSGLAREKAYHKAKDLLISFGLEDKSHMKPSELSGGQQQKAAICRALILEPDIILADEPTGSLDEKAALEIMDILKDISKSRLVVMVTHQIALAKAYASRIIEMQEAMIVKDKVLTHIDNNAIRHIDKDRTPHMSLMTSFGLSFSNLIKRKYRTTLMLIAASLGVIGILLVLSVSFGFNQFIEGRKDETLNAFPIRVERISYVVPFIDDKYRPDLPAFPEDTQVYSRNIQYEYQTINTLTEAYYTYVKQMPTHMYDHIHFDYQLKSNFLVEKDQTYHSVQNYIKELEVSLSYMQDNFDVLYGRLPEEGQLEAILILDRYNRLSKDIAQSLGFLEDDILSFETLTDVSMKWIPNNVMYTYDNDAFLKTANHIAYHHEQAIDIEIVGIVRIDAKFELDFLRTGIYYTNDLTKHIISDAQQSDIVGQQRISQTHVIDGQLLNSTQKDQVLRSFGYQTYPLAYAIYSSDFKDKQLIMDYLRAYNQSVSLNQSIEPLDIAGIGLATMQTAINATSIILIVFSLISLLVSNLMIGIMTYTSVIERTKEIGLLTAIGARTKHIKHIFYAETAMIGMFSGLFSIAIAYSLMPLLNMALHQITGIPQVASLSIVWAFVLLILHTLSTMISGIIPARVASRMQPMKALKND